MSKRPVPSSPQPNPRPSKTRLTNRSQNEAHPEKPRANAQDIRNILGKNKALHDKTNAPKVTTGKPSKPDGKIAQKKATDTTAAKPKVAIAPNAATSSKPVAQPKSKTGDVSTKPSTASRKGKVIEEIVLSSDGSDDRDSDYEDVPDDEQDNDNGLVAEPEVDESGEEEPDEAELIPEDKSDGEPEAKPKRGRKPKARTQTPEDKSDTEPEDKPEDAPTTKPKRGRKPKAKGGDDESVVKGKAKGKGGPKPKGKVQRARPSTNRVQRKSVALTTPAARDMFNGMDKFLNKWAKCSELNILRTREERKTYEVRMSFLEKEAAHHQAMVNYEETWMKRKPARVEEYHNIHLQDSKRKLLEAEQKAEKVTMERLSLEMELINLREENKNLKKKQKEDEEEAEDEEERRDMERMQQLYNNM